MTKSSSPRWRTWMAAPLAAFLPMIPVHADMAAIESARTFHASFDSGINADDAKGDARIYTRTGKEGQGSVGIETDGATQLVKEGGLEGGALKFTKAKAPWVFFKADKNVPYNTEDWSGTVSCWLKLDPEEDLEPGYCDPVQLTTRAWNDGAFFVDFNKEGDPRDFRLGAFADLAVWNPEKKEVPESERPLYSVKNPPFGRDR